MAQTRSTRFSVSSRLASVADYGGVNSFRSFARSWQRAASFAEVIPRRPSLVISPEQRPPTDGCERRRPAGRPRGARRRGLPRRLPVEPLRHLRRPSAPRRRRRHRQLRLLPGPALRRRR